MTYANQTDRTLLVAAAGGDEQAFARLYQRYVSRLTAFVYERCGREQSLAQDLVQQTFLQLLQSKAFAHPREGGDSLGPLLYAIATNVARNHDRGERRRNAHHQALALVRREDAFAPQEAPNRTPELQRVLTSLSPSHREVVELRFGDGLTLEEIAAVLDCPPGTVKSRLHYALRKLAGLLRSSTILL